MTCLDKKPVFPTTHRWPLVWLAIALVVLAAHVPVSAGAQSTSAAASPDTTPVRAAAPADVNSMDAILRALYDVISGPAGPRDWQRFRSLFVPGARLIPTRHDSTGHVSTAVMTPKEYAQRAGHAFDRNAFYEREIARTANTFGAITQVFSTYASRRSPDAAPFARGINSIQLFNDGTRWYVVTIYWDAERPGTTIPTAISRPPNSSWNS